MSKAFTKDDAPDEAVVIPSRPPLPEGVPNYVTGRGLTLLREELELLEKARADVGAPTDDPARAIEFNTLSRQVVDLTERIATANLVDPGTQPHDTVRFGAKVAVLTHADEERSYTIVGVDEADVDHGRIAFTAPVARALLGRRVGDEVKVRTPSGVERLEVTGIVYNT